MAEFFALIQQFLAVLGQFINIPAALVGVGVIFGLQKLVPGPVGAADTATMPGAWYTRLLPFAGPLAAFIACALLEWDKTYSAADFVRGFNSGLGSEFILKIYFKTWKGI